MRKICLWLIVGTFLLMAISAFAQQPRGNKDIRDLGLEYLPSEGLTMFTNLGVMGLNVDGVPGYIEMISSAGRIFYLYIDDTNTLRIASPSQVATTASPNTTDWGNAGERIGSQP